MSQPAELATERLILRMPQPADADAITERIAIKDIVWNLGRAPFPYKRSDAESWLETVPKGWAEDTAYVFAITTADDGMIGSIGLDRHPEDIWEIGYWLAKPWWGQGLVTEAGQAVLAWARESQGIDQFMSGHFTDNPASGRVLVKLGFEPVGEIDMTGRARGVPAPCTRYVCGAPAEAALRLAAH